MTWSPAGLFAVNYLIFFSLKLFFRQIRELLENTDEINIAQRWLFNLAALSWFTYLHTPLRFPHRDTHCRRTHSSAPSPGRACLCRRTGSCHSGRTLAETPVGGTLWLCSTCWKRSSLVWAAYAPNMQLVKTSVSLSSRRCACLYQALTAEWRATGVQWRVWLFECTAVLIQQTRRSKTQRWNESRQLKLHLQVHKQVCNSKEFRRTEYFPRKHHNK